jgi:hypothetical protein
MKGTKVADRSEANVISLHIIMTALRRDGVAINEIDMMDASLRTRSLKSKE